MKKLMGLAVVLAVLLGVCTISAFASPLKATLAILNSTVNEDANSAAKMNAFTIGGDTYVSLGDLAHRIDGTLSTFDFTTDASKNVIKITTQRQYTAKILNELYDAKANKVKSAAAASPTVYINGNKTKLTAYTIDKNTYFKLKDLAKAFKFTFKITGSEFTIKTSSKILFNGYPYYLTQIVSADGKTQSTDESIKKQFGNPLPIFTFKYDGTYTVVRNGKTFKGQITENDGETFKINTIGDPTAKSSTKYLVYVVGDTYKIATNPNVAYTGGYLLTPSLKTVNLTSGAPTSSNVQVPTGIPTPTSVQIPTGVQPSTDTLTPANMQTPAIDQTIYPPGTSPEEINKAISDYLKENGLTTSAEPSK